MDGTSWVDEFNEVQFGGVGLHDWIDLFLETYSMTSVGLLFRGWPDGAATLDQPALELAVFKVIKDEVIQWTTEQTKNR